MNKVIEHIIFGCVYYILGKTNEKHHQMGGIGSDEVSMNCYFDAGSEIQQVLFIIQKYFNRESK